MGSMLGNEEIIRDEFSDWFQIVSDCVHDSEVKTSNDRRKYYVYALCKKNDDGSLTPFYIGKGTGARVWCHSDEAKNEEAEIEEEAKKFKWTSEEKQLRLDTLKAKHRMLVALKEDKLARIVIKSGLTEYESFMCESALINIFRMKGLLYTEPEKLTNLVNGHANPFEDFAEIRTAAISVEEYYQNYCKKPIIIGGLTPEQKTDFKDKKILLQNINKFYPDCINSELFPTANEQKEAIREAVRAFWTTGIPEKMDYVIALYKDRIKGIYQVKRVYRKSDNRFYRALDIWRDDYPKFDKLPGRKRDLEESELIYNALLRQGLIDSSALESFDWTSIEGVYTKLSKDTQLAFNSFYNENDFARWLKHKKLPYDEQYRIQFYSNKLDNWVQRWYFVLEEITDEPLSKYMNCKVLEMYSTNKTRSVFAKNPELNALYFNNKEC